jgi:hypothetical protein
MVVHLAVQGGRIGFVHIACGPSRLWDDRRNRRGSIAVNERFEDLPTEVRAFVVCVERAQHPSVDCPRKGSRRR